MVSHRNRTVAQKTARAKEKREERFSRKREEKRNPALRLARLEKNKPLTLDQKRVWDDVDNDELSSSVDLQVLRRRRIQQAEEAERQAIEAVQPRDDDENEDDADSMLDSEEEKEGDNAQDPEEGTNAQARPRQDSIAPSVASTSNFDLTPESLLLKFPHLFSDGSRPPEPKILITTGLDSTLHHVARTFESIIPGGKYVRRSAHKYGHKYSVREITKFAENRGFSSLLVIREDNKKPVGLDVVDIPSKVTFHFSISSWVEGRKLPGHGNATNHYPELLLNNFSTPLGLVASKLLGTLFPSVPELAGRQCVVFHNSRDYIFFRRHRYIIRDKKATEKSVVGADGKEMRGVENLRAGLQELGPRFTLKLRRIDRGIGRAGSDPVDPTHWEWKAKMEKNRKRFNL
ncbi:putative ribosome production factor 1 [Rosellinia necatrix]|uniref:Putative ribosome production factor 1 n=1 Tax=Rosellinia necatrix TaxID=77044 RepID=A0A1W2TMX3_ROSNE|nr:putative ribosome production factor 1 [Rosellinia necatrix]